MKPTNPEDDDEEEIDDTKEAALEDRMTDYAQYKYIQSQLADVWSAVARGYEDKEEQNGIIDDCWDAFNCVLGGNQNYTGVSEVYVPVIRDALLARETRFINMLFPQTGRFVDIVGNNGETPYELVALMDKYIKEAKLRQLVAPSMIRTGDVTGQYALYPEWIETTRHVTSKTKVSEMQNPMGDDVEEADSYDDIEYEKIKEGRPGVTVLDARDYLMLPATTDDPQDCEIVSITLKFTKAKIKKWIKAGIFEKAPAKMLLQNMGSKYIKQPDTGKKALSSIGIKTDSKGNKQAFIQQVWCKLKIKGEERLMVVHFAGEDNVLGCKRNPYWCDRVPLITQPVEKVPNSVWGKSQVDPVLSLQYEANDAVNKGFDSSSYALLPIIMTDPEKNPQAGSMVLAMAAIWYCDPNSTKFAEFPALWKDAFTIVGSCKQQIFESLSVNPAMIPHGNAGKKPSQAQVAQEQQVALESSSDNVAAIQEGMFSQLVEWFYEFDYQYRTEAVTVKKYGEFGLQASMDQVEPFQVRSRYEFKWYGTEGFKATQQVQQQISWLNVISKIPPQQLNGRKVDVGPLIEQMNGTILGPRLAPKVLIDQRHQLTMTVQLENQLLHQGFPIQVHEMDDDPEHIQGHMQEFGELLQMPPEIIEGNNTARMVKGHILEHIKAMKMKATMAQGAQPGQQGAPRPGAMVQAPSGGQQPAGAVHQDQMPMNMPRKGM